jgi:hypothetical protein
MFSYVGGGASNNAPNTYSTIVGGYNNTASGCYSFIGGGENNTITGSHSTIGGGCSNVAQGIGAYVTGSNNIVNPEHTCAFIIGNTITSADSDMLHTNKLWLSAAALSTADPGVQGVVWNDGGTLKISL